MIAAISTQPPARSPPHKERDYLSFSAIKLYQTCPLRYFFKYVAQLPDEVVSASLVFGGAIHRAIEFHFRELLAGNPSPDLEALLSHYRLEWQERNLAEVRFGKSEDAPGLEELAGRMLGKFRESRVARPAGTILAIEEELRGELVPGLPDLLARVDLILETPDVLVISDWKTARSRWSNEQVEESADQLLLYSHLAADFAPGKQLRIEFAVLTKTKESAIDVHSLSVDPRRVTRAKRVVEQVWRSIAAENFYPAPSPMACPGCPYRTPCRKWPG